MSVGSMYTMKLLQEGEERARPGTHQTCHWQMGPQATKLPRSTSEKLVGLAGMCAH